MTPLVIYGLGGGHIHTYFGGMKVISRNQALAWFKNTIYNTYHYIGNINKTQQLTQDNYKHKVIHKCLYNECQKDEISSC